MPSQSSPISGPLTDEQQTEIRSICTDHDVELDRVEVQSGVLILSPSDDGEHPDASVARTIAKELKDLGFEFVTITAPATTDDQPHSNGSVGQEPTEPFEP